jgi:hypothetical protein
VRLFDNCLEAPCKGTHLTRLAEISVGERTSQLRLEQAGRAHNGDTHTEWTESLLLLPDTNVSPKQQPGK